MPTSSNDMARKHGNSPTKEEQSSSRRNKDGKKYVKLQIPGQKNKHLGKRKDKSEDGTGPGHGTSAGYEITDGYCVSPAQNLTKRSDLEKDRRDMK